MSARWSLAAAVLLVSGASAPLLSREPDTARVQSLAWLGGCWEAAGPRRVVQEHWMHPAGGTMLGVSRTLRRGERADSTVEYEFIRIFVRGGKLVYAALPSGQEPTEFVESELSDESVAFTNPTHDFPQTVRYRKSSADSLHARIEGTMNGSARGIDFRYRRVPCDRASGSS